MSHPTQPTGGNTTISREDECIVEISRESSVESSRADADSKILLRNSAALPTCCIFRIPHTLVQANETAYKPKIVSIGPYHHDDGNGDKAEKADKARFRMIQQRKQRYLKIFLARAKKMGVVLEDLQNVVRKKEKEIRDSYSEDLQLNQPELIDLMVRDGCFILLLFLVFSGKVQHKTSQDPIFTLRWILPTLRSDLLLLENQVPLFFLQELLETSKLATDISLNKMIFTFFGYSIIMPPEFWDKRIGLEGSHLLDLIRKAFLPDQPKKTKGKWWTIPNMLSVFKIKVQAETSTPTSTTTPTTPTSTTTPTPTLTTTPTSTTTPTEAHSRPSPPPSRPFFKLVFSTRKLQLGGIKFKRKKKSETPLPTTQPQAHSKQSTPPSRPFLKLIYSAIKLQLGGINSKLKKKFETLLPTQAHSKQSTLPSRPFLKLVYSAKKLQLGGIKFKRKKIFETPLDITYKSGVLEIPLLIFDDFFSSLLINFVAFEQFNMQGTTDMTSYVIFMGCLINTAEDATFLTEKGIIENYFGTGEQVSLFFKNTAKDIVFTIHKSYLSKVFEGVNKYTSQRYSLKIQWAGIRYTYFNSPWTFLSSFAAFSLLGLTIFQAVMAGYAYYRPRN